MTTTQRYFESAPYQWITGLEAMGCAIPPELAMDDEIWDSYRDALRAVNEESVARAGQRALWTWSPRTMECFRLYALQVHVGDDLDNETVAAFEDYFWAIAQEEIG